MPWSDIRRWRQAIAITVLLALAPACQPVPQPFAHEGASTDSVIAPMSDAGGITVLSVSGAPDKTAGALLVAMADSLAEHDIPAATGTGNRLSRFVQGTARAEPDVGDRLRVELIWDLFDRPGTLLGSRKVTRTIPAADWTGANPRALRPLTDSAAAEIATLILRPSAEPAAQPPRLHVWPVEGVPEGDNAALQRALEAALRRRDFVIVPTLDGAGLVISGQFTAGPANSAQRPIEITWAVLDARGQELGNLTQRNAVPASSLESGWKSLAAVIAEGAAGGVGDLINRLPPEALRTGAAATR